MNARLLACLLFSGAVLAQAESVVFVGQDLDLGPYWRTSTVAKSLDIDGDNVYGTLGYALFAVHADGGWTGGADQWNYNMRQSLPGYLSVAPSTRIPRSWTGNFTRIDDPANPAGADIWSGLAYCTYLVECPAGAFYPLFDISVGAGLGSGTLRLGVFSNNENPPADLEVLVRGSGATSGLQTIPTVSGYKNNYYFFDLTGLDAGDVVRVQGHIRPSGSVGLSGFTFDYRDAPPAVFEPATGALVGAALITLGALRRRRRGQLQ